MPDQSPPTAPTAQALNVLTRREAQIVSHVSLGLTDKQIARELGISPHTVSNHLRNISRKTGGARRCALVLLCMKMLGQAVDEAASPV